MAEIRPVGGCARPRDRNQPCFAQYLPAARADAGVQLDRDVRGGRDVGAPYLGFFPTLIGFFGLLFVVQRLANSAWGLLAVFAFTGFLGYTLGPLLSMYLKMPHGPQLVGQALGADVRSHSSVCRSTR